VAQKLKKGERERKRLQEAQAKQAKKKKDATVKGGGGKTAIGSDRNNGGGGSSHPSKMIAKEGRKLRRRYEVTVTRL